MLLETPLPARWVTDRLSVAGLGFALMSSLLLLCAVFAASHAGGASEAPGDASRAGPQPTRPADMPDATLAATYSPVLLCTAAQRWTPIPVDVYVRRATATDWEGRASRIGGVRDLATGCPGVVRAPGYSLRQHCPSAADEAACAEQLPDDRAVYVRVARSRQWRRCPRAAACADASPNPFARARGPYAAANHRPVLVLLPLQRVGRPGRRGEPE